MIRHHRVADLGPLPAPRLAPNVTVQQALQFLVRGRRGAIVAVDAGKPVGILTERDIVYRMTDGMFTSAETRRRTPIRAVMSSPCATIRRQASLHDAIHAMVQASYRHLVVIDGKGDLQGLLTGGDVIQFLTDHFPEETINLPPRLHQRYDSRGGA